MTSFALKGHPGQLYHAAFSYTPLQIKGHFNLQGPQAVNDDGGCPTWVGRIFAENENIQQLAVNSKTNGAVWSRMRSEGDPEESAKPKSYRFISEEDVRSMFSLARIEILTAYKLVNEYDGDSDCPWWLLKTPHGLIKLGWRKSVISINWVDTPVRKIITSDKVTSELMLVHADSSAKALEYLTSLSRELAGVR